MSASEPVVILGGGIIGLSIAYYLSQDDNFARQIHIIDSADKLLESASGYAGGFLARDWFPERAAALGNLSFDLHRQLADANGGQARWGYAGSHVYSLSLDDAPAGVRGEDWLLAGTSRAQSAGRRAYGHASAPGEAVNADGTPAWISPQTAASWNVVAGIDDCAQVEPRKLCQFLLSECRSRKVQIHLSTKATAVLRNGAGDITGLKLASTGGPANATPPKSIPCGEIVIAAGCWSPRVFDTLFPKSNVKLGIDSLAGHSIIYRTPRYKDPFVNITWGKGDQAHHKDKNIAYAIYCPPTKSWSYSPEAYARLDGNGGPEIWIGGLNHDSTELPLPELATDSKKLIKKDSIADLRRAAVQLTGSRGKFDGANEDDLEVVSEALCFRPIRAAGFPLITNVPYRDLGLGSPNRSGAKVWLACGHGPWGIALSLATGVVVRDLIRGVEPSVDVSELKYDMPIQSKL